MSINRVHFNRPYLTGNELRYMTEAINEKHIAGNGEFTKKCQSLLEQELPVKKVLLTTSCTHALEMAALLLNIQPGDEVIVPAFTFVSTVNAFVLRGARPKFIDIRPDTLNMDEVLLERLVSPRTKAIVPVHYAGVACEMDSILDVAQRYGIAIVEDNAQGLFGKYKGRYLGTFGCLAAQSFHETKNFTCGEGGALIINDAQYIERAEIIWEKGTNRTRFFRGQVDKYTWVDIGSSYVLSDLLAAYLYAQLEARHQIQEQRKQIWAYYFKHLETWANNHNFRLPSVPQSCEIPYHMFYVLLASLEQRQAMIRDLSVRGVNTVFHYLPLHLSEMGRRFGGKQGDCPVTEDVSSRLLRLPFHNNLTERDLASVVTAVTGVSLQAKAST